MRTIPTIAAIALAFACGGTAPPPSPVVVAAVDTRPEGSRSAPMARAGDARLLPEGSNGPRDAVGLVGDAGRVVMDRPPTLLFVNGAVIRHQPSAGPFRHALLATLSGWGLFMPFEVVDPITEVDWVIMAGSIYIGRTRDNVFLAHYSLSDARETDAENQLLSRLPNAQRGQPPTLLTTFVDRAQRTYLRPKKGVLAIVPPARATSTAETLAPLDVPLTVRPGELVRVIWNGPRDRALAAVVPSPVENMRAWVTANPQGQLRLSVEGECKTEAEADDAAKEVRSRLSELGRSAMVRLVAGAVLSGNNVWPDGKTVRYDAPIDDRVLEAVAILAQCRGQTPCED